jgi:hypothetical protein
MVESSVYQSGVFKEKKDLEMEMMSKLWSQKSIFRVFRLFRLISESRF